MSKGLTNSIIGGAGEGLYVWKKYKMDFTEIVNTEETPPYTTSLVGGVNNINLQIGANYSKDDNTGKFVLNDITNTVLINAGQTMNLSLITSRYFIIYGEQEEQSSSYLYQISNSQSLAQTPLTVSNRAPKVTLTSQSGGTKLIVYTAVGTKSDFLSYITSDSILSYPVNGQKGDYWYELVQSNVDWGEVTLTTAQNSITVQHNLGEKPKWCGIFPNEKVQSWSYGTSYGTALSLIKDGAKWEQIRGGNLYEESIAPMLSNNSIGFKQSYNFYPLTYYWFAIGSPKSFLSILSWQQIGDLVLKAEQGTVNLQDYFSIGDTKPVTLTTGETIELQIAGFNHDTFSDGVTAPVTFVMKDCLNTKAQMNSSSTNAGGYPASAMKSWVENNIYDKLPSDLKTLVAPVKKKWYTTHNDANSLTEGNYNVWLLSEMEVSGTNTYTIGNGEGSKYDIFTDNASRIKKVNGTNNYWWLGSCVRSYSNSFVGVSSGGSVGYGNAGGSGGVAAGLCIGGGNS